MDGIPALGLWDLVKEVFHSSPHQFNNTKDQVRGNSSRDATSNKHHQNKTKVPTHHDNLDVGNVDRSWLVGQFATAKTYVFSDAGVSTEPVQAWESKIEWFFGNSLSQRLGSDRRGADGVRVEKFPRIHYIWNSRRDSKDDDWIKVWTRATQREDHLHVNVQWHWLVKTRKENCIANALRVAEYARRFTQGHGSFLGSGSEKKWYGTHVNKPNGEWETTAEDRMLNFAGSGHPIFRATSALWEHRERSEIHSHSLQR